MRIGILGAGSAGAMAAMVWLNEVKKINGLCEVVCIYNPNIPVINVGESTASPLVTQMVESADFKPLRDLHEFNGTIKYGTWYTGFGKEKFNTWHGQPAIHLDASKFSGFIIERLAKIHTRNQVFTVIYDTILSYVDYQEYVDVFCDNGTYRFDFIIDCSGFPNEYDREEECESPEFETVNSAIVYPETGDTNEMYTSAESHEHGWMFGIPLTHRKAHGFLYNNKITSHEEAAESFKKLKNLSDEQLSQCNKFSWKWFHRKYMVKNRIIYSGNKLYFYEPAQALSLLYYMFSLREHCLCVLKGQYNKEAEYVLNQQHLSYMSDIYDLHCFYYQGSKHLDSPFWKETREKTMKRLQQSEHFKTWILNWEKGDQRGYSFHPRDVMKIWLEGLTGCDKSFYDKFR